MLYLATFHAELFSATVKKLTRLFGRKVAQCNVSEQTQGKAQRVSEWELKGAPDMNLCLGERLTG